LVLSRVEFVRHLQKNIEFDIIAGTSIGVINGAIIAGSKNDDTAKDVEDFWMEIEEVATTSYQIHFLLSMIIKTIKLISRDPLQHY